MPTPSVAHVEDLGVYYVVDKVTPSMPDVDIEVRLSVAAQLIAENRSHTPLEIIGEDGFAFLRIALKGVEANLNSPDFHQSLIPEGQARLPEGAAPRAAPRFESISTDPSYGWFDHRLHPSNSTSQSWSIPIRYGDQDGAVTGRRLRRKLKGGYRATVTKQIPGTQATALQGSTPAITLLNNSSGQVTLFNANGAPFADVLPGARLTWLEERAKFTDTKSVPSKKILQWQIPARAENESVLLEGVTAFIPNDEVLKKERRSVPGILVIAAVAGLSLSILFRKRKAGPRD